MSVSAGVCGGGEVRWLGGVGCGCGVKLGGWGGVGGVEVGWLGAYNAPNFLVTIHSCRSSGFLSTKE